MSDIELNPRAQRPRPPGPSVLLAVAEPGRRAALFWFGAAVLVLAFGVGMAIRQFPGEFDWMYTVISHLASTTRNPDGGRWASGALFFAVLLLWPATHFLARTTGRADILPRAAVAALRIGLICCAALALEGLLELDYSRHLRKGHEIVALFAFLGCYGGVLGMYLHRIRETASLLVPALMVILPLCAIGITQLALYFDQRDLGWVDTGWREMGIPVWLSFAFWQWLAGIFLGLGLGCLIVTGDGEGARGARGSGDGSHSRDRNLTLTRNR